MTVANLGLKPRRLHSAIWSQSGGRETLHKGTGMGGLNPHLIVPSASSLQQELPP
ncbi:hypothetical protein [Nostoc sp. NMS8]|uniref:hypothetical protein n=1 Tax=Nostoc sp. NMS8 TaxID=2815392 RepID=UPI0025F9955C|nr:hypothetical protein [Nostoc sp. NMS8]MBN3961652.1 hypothetical protein [Nostoc sp. NMS8]